MATSLFELSAKLLLEKKDYEKGLDQAESKASTFGGKLGQTMSVVGKGVGVAMTAVTTAVVATTKIVADSVKDVEEYGDMVDKTSQKLGLSTDSFQEWDYVLNLAGTSMQDMTTGMKTLTNKIADAKNGSSEAQADFKKLGISMGDLKTMSREEIFSKVIEGMQNMGESTERASIANDLFGKSGQNLTPVFNMTNQQTAELIANAREYGMVISEDAIKASADFKDSVTTLQTSFSGLKRTATAELLPALTSVMNGLTKVMNGQGGLDDISSGIDKFIDKLTSGLPKIIDQAEKIVLSVAKAITAKIPDVIKMGTKVVDSLLKGILDALPDLITQIVRGLSQSLPSLLAGLIQWVADIVSALPEIIIAIVDVIPDLIAGIVVALVEAIPQLLAGALKCVVAIAEHLPEYNLKIIEMIPKLMIAIAKGIWDASGEILDVFEDLWEDIKGTFQRGKEKSREVLSDTKQWFTNKSKEDAKAYQDSWEKIDKFFGDKFESAKTLIGKAFDKVKPMLAGHWENIKKYWQESNIGKFFGEIFENARKAISEKFGLSTDDLGEIWQKIKDKFADAYESFKEIGRNIVEGIKQGILAKWNQFKQWFDDKVLGLVKGTKKNLGVASPSKVFKQIGEYCVEGFQIGFKDLANGTAMQIPNASVTVTGDIRSNELLNKILTKLESMNIYLDTGALVGGLSNGINIELGKQIVVRGI